MKLEQIAVPFVQGDRGRYRDIQTRHRRGHRNVDHFIACRQHIIRNPGRFGTDQENFTFARLDATKVHRTWTGLERDNPELQRTQPVQRLEQIGRDPPWDAKHVAHRNPGRFAVQRVGASGIQQHRIGLKSSHVSENGANVVHIGDANGDHHPLPSRRGQAYQTILGFQLTVVWTMPRRQDPTMDTEAGNLDHARERSDVDGNVIRQAAKDIFHVLHGGFRQQQTVHLFMVLDKACDHTLGLHQEQVVPSPQITISNIAIRLEPGIFEIVNENDHSRERTRISAGAAVTT